MKIGELQIAIETYPRRLSEAMEAVDKAEKAIEKLNEQIEEEEANLSPDDSSSVESGQGGNQEEERLRIEHELALLELDYEQLKGEIEMEYRRNPPGGDKVTEATVTAVVKSNKQLVAAKRKCIDKLHERNAANIARRVGYTARRTEESKVPVTSPKLEKLRERLFNAELTLSGSETKVEEVKAGLPTYQMLVQLYTAGLIK
ncbi:MAG: hypothetical protein ACRDIV_23040 [Ktedonobacteraceae bacterium]